MEGQAFSVCSLTNCGPSLHRWATVCFCVCPKVMHKALLSVPGRGAAGPARCVREARRVGAYVSWASIAVDFSVLGEVFIFFVFSWCVYHHFGGTLWLEAWSGVWTVWGHASPWGGVWESRNKGNTCGWVKAGMAFQEVPEAQGWGSPHLQSHPMVEEVPMHDAQRSDAFYFIVSLIIM